MSSYPVEHGESRSPGRDQILSRPSSTETPSPDLSLRGVTKRFPHVLANDNINLDVYRGEVHAILGENGAGKSTLMKILYGFYQADAGTIRVGGVQATIESPRDAMAHRRRSEAERDRRTDGVLADAGLPAAAPRAGEPARAHRSLDAAGRSAPAVSSTRACSRLAMPATS